MSENCFGPCKYAKNEFIDEMIVSRWNNEDDDVFDFLNSFNEKELKGIACNLLHRDDLDRISCSFDIDDLDAGSVLSDYFRSWIIDNLRGGLIDDAGQLFCALHDIMDVSGMMY